MGMDLRDFVTESNRIEGILREPTSGEIIHHKRLLMLSKITIPDMERFVEGVQHGAQLRDLLGMNVRVGLHLAPAGGPHIAVDLSEILKAASVGASWPYDTHHRYERLHPFTDGNGRSGRVLWLWMMRGIEQAPLGFLHHFYYQALQAGR